MRPKLNEQRQRLVDYAHDIIVKKKRLEIESFIQSMNKCAVDVQSATTFREVENLLNLFYDAFTNLHSNISVFWLKILFPVHYKEITEIVPRSEYKLTYLDENAEIQVFDDFKEIVLLPNPPKSATIINSKIGLVSENGKNVFYKRLAIVTSFKDFCDRWSNRFSSKIMFVPNDLLDI